MDENELHFDRNGDPLDLDSTEMHWYTEGREHQDDYQCPHDWIEISIGNELCSECSICHAIDC